MTIQNQAEKNAPRKKRIDFFFKIIFKTTAALTVVFIALILIQLILKGIKPFLPNYSTPGHEYPVNLFDFIFGMKWIDDSSTNTFFFGAGYLMIDTFIVTIISILFALPSAIFASLFIVKIAPKKIAFLMTTVIELLASIPSVVYGVFGANQIVHVVKSTAELFNYQTAGGLSLLSAGIVLSLMITPIVTAVAISSLKAISQDLESASLALGATKMQTYTKVLLPAAKKGIFAGLILGVGRALGEATAVAMVAGNSNTGPTFNLFDITATLTSKMLIGLKESTGITYDIRFSLGLFLVGMIFLTNFLLNKIKRKIGTIS